MYNVLNRTSKRRRDEAEKQLTQFRLRVVEKPDPGSRVAGSESEYGKIESQNQAIRVNCTFQLHLSLLLPVHRHLPPNFLAASPCLLFSQGGDLKIWDILQSGPGNDLPPDKTTSLRQEPAFKVSQLSFVFAPEISFSDIFFSLNPE
ncbi:hypothetical protein V2J09_000083 [Rumex salicifolius]